MNPNWIKVCTVVPAFAAAALCLAKITGKKTERKDNCEPLEGHRKYVLGLSSDGFHKVSFMDWGDPSNHRVMVCVHGLTRNCRDFDVLARHFCKEFRVVCVDVVGRGHSDWLRNKNNYGYAQYMNDLNTVLAHIAATSNSDPKKPMDVTWIGTSMGGLIGMMLAAHEHSPIHRLILNDIGPEVPLEALQRIGSYLGKGLTWKTPQEADEYFAKLYQCYGPTFTSEHLQHMRQHSTVYNKEQGLYSMHYDQDIKLAFNASLVGATKVDIWPVWHKVRIPVLVLHGELSDVLPRDVCDRMETLKETSKGSQGPSDLTVLHYPHTGHVVPLVTRTADGDIKQVEEWIRRRL